MNKIKKILFIVFLLCAIITIKVVSYSATNITLKSITYNNKTYSFYPECIRYHVKANGYNKKIKDELKNNLYEYAAIGPGKELQTEYAKMQGYGNYVFKEDTNLFNFIEYCYLLDKDITTALCVYNGKNELNSCDYTKLITYSGKKLNSNSIIFVNNFWDNMTKHLGELFNSCQDLYFFDKYTNKGASIVFSQDKLENNGKEFLTCMMSYIFSTNQNSSHKLEIKKGDIVPFLYVKEHIDDAEIKNNPKEIAKFAYLSCIKKWADVTVNDLWLEEYEEIFGEYNERELCEMVGEDIETLAKWYSETDRKYQNQKGKKGNNLLGEDIEFIIESDYSIEDQVEAIDYLLRKIEGIGDYKENMARNSLMAKYMMENKYIKDTIKDYNVGITFITDNLQRGTSMSKNTNTAVLSDFTILEFDHRLNVDGMSDEDGLTDLFELTGKEKGDIEKDNIWWVDITGPATKMYEDMKNNGKITKSKNKEEAFKDLVKKNPGFVKYEDEKLYYKTYDYISNPMLNDTDFDGINDDIDKNKTRGKFEGYAGKIGEVEYILDFRWFFTDNKKYNDELAVMSLILSNLAEGSYAPLNDVVRLDAPVYLNFYSMNEYLKYIGFSEPIVKDKFKISETENISGNVYLTKKTIQIGENKKTVRRYKDVYGIFLGGFDTEENLKKLVSNFDKKEISNYYKNIADDIINYINENKPNTTDEYCYWICGYSIAGGIAGEVASRLANNNEVFCYTFGATNTNMTGSGAYSCIKNIINEDDLYPKIYNKDDNFSRKGSIYNDSIYDNLKREYSDIVGNFKSYKANPKRTNTIKQKLKIVREKVDFINYVNSIKDILANYLKNHLKILDKFFVGLGDEFHPFQAHYSNELVNLLNKNIDEIKKGHEMKSYYVLSKSLNGYDLNNNDVDWEEVEKVITSEREIPELTEEDIDYQNRLKLLIESIETVGKAYLENVYTYHGADAYAYTGEKSIENRIAKKVSNQNSNDYDVIDEIETIEIDGEIKNIKKKLKTSTINAYEKWNERKLEVKEKIDNNVDIEYNFDMFKNLYTQMKTVENKKTTSNPTAIHYLDLFDEFKSSGKNHTIYNFDNTIEIGKANTKTFVGDDCSCFAAAVYWYYLNQLEKANNLDDIDLWYTGSKNFISKSDNSQKLSIYEILLNNDFEIYQWESDKKNNIKGIEDIGNFVLQPGDLLYRKSQNGKNAHVEFYLGEKHSFGWGEIHSSYENKNESKHFKIIRNLDIYNIGKTIKANNANEGDVYRIENKTGGGIYNTIYRKTDNNCRYDYVIRLGKKTNTVVEVGNE